MSHRDCHKLHSGFLEIMKSFGRIVSVLLPYLYDRLTPVSQGLGFPLQKRVNNNYEYISLEGDYPIIREIPLLLLLLLLVMCL
jgi:hypothetical protein